MQAGGNTVLITGSGIGLASARRLAARNLVVVCGKRDARLQVATATVPGPQTIRADLARHYSGARMMADATAAMSRLEARGAPDAG